MTSQTSDIRQKLMNDFGFFCTMLAEAEAEGRSRPDRSSRTFDETTEAELAKAVTGLQDDGFHIWRGFLPSDQVEALRTIAYSTRPRSAELAFLTKQVTDPETGWSYLKPKGGRTRATLALDGSCTLPDSVNSLCRNERLAEAVERTYRCQTAPTFVCFEHLLPCSEQLMQWWHIDRVMDQCKALVLLNDVEEGNGPMLLARRSHIFTGQRRAIDFIYFREGPNFSDVPAYVAFEHETVPTVGKAGDVVLFNTRAFHATGRATEGERLTATLYFGALDTPLNRLLHRYQPGHWI